MSVRYTIGTCTGLYESAKPRASVSDSVTGDHARFTTDRGAAEVARDLNRGRINRSMLQWHDPSQCKFGEVTA